MKRLLNRLVPDVWQTVTRYWLAVIFCVAATVSMLVYLNRPDLSRYDGPWPIRLLPPGLLFAALYAVAGQHMREGGAGPRWLRVVAAWAVPVLVLGAVLADNLDWVVWAELLPVGVIWVTLAPFLGDRRGEAEEHAYWQFAHRAIVTALLALLGLCLIWGGLMVIQMSVGRLFRLELGDLMLNWVLPVVGGLFTPVYWLSTLPQPQELRAEAPQTPDFLSRAIGFIGQFVLIPFLLLYSGILLAYAVQVAVTRQLPVNTIGWMVLGYVVAGAVTWLIVSPRFMRERWLVGLFRRLWFWLTLVPLGLMAIAIFIRVQHHGLTSERMLLVAGGLWAAAIAIIFLMRRGDIRLIAGLGAALLLVLSIGPWNMHSLPILQQSARLEALLSLPGKDGASFPPAWNSAQVDQAANAMSFLDQKGRRYSTSPFAPAEDALDRILAKYGIVIDRKEPLRSAAAMAALGYRDELAVAGYVVSQDFMDFKRTATDSPVDVRATPTLIGALVLYSDRTETIPGHLVWVTANQTLVIAAQDGSSRQVVDLSGWIDLQVAKKKADMPGFFQPWIDFTLNTVRYRFVADSMSLWRNVDQGWALSDLRGTLFSSAPPPSPADQPAPAR